MDEREIEVVANLAEVQEWEENEPMRTPAVRVPPPPPPPSSMSSKRTRADMELVSVVSDPPSSNPLRRVRANMELVSVVSDAVTAGIQACVSFTHVVVLLAHTSGQDRTVVEDKISSNISGRVAQSSAGMKQSSRVLKT